MEKLKGLKENIKLARYTTYKIGGPAKYFYAAKTEQQIVGAVQWARKNNVPYFILGGGSNILVSDKGFDGLVIRIKNQELRIKNGNIVESGAGIDLPELIKFIIGSSLKGIEWGSGIPGTFGGAVRGNAGAFGGEIKDILTSVRFLDDKGDVRTLNNKECNFSYRSSIFKQNPEYIILSAILKFKQGDREALQKKSRDTIDFRASRHPLEYGSCGSIFKAIEVSVIPKSTFVGYQKIRDSIKDDPFPVVPAACFIDEAGLKYTRIGGAMVSAKHPNFFVNTNQARAEDVMILISLVRQRIINTFGVIPEEEVQYVGF